ncbi:hypothetical protein COCMIDRAFT_22381 [Bipolaris oryzae ATCC 44560]|uniref:Uncharacterized protein n=1 Tax=Bipolaris oryzae ATCC 44560 TaxID=930090 RepID=W7A1Z6_COCMI|nr:uncharacterized protein COCMIDRAFT_22381 [Bipolaris oryzae ATCC 44560]EUC50051.1 hypothetical protein COCMIDRAFT_22381 [Bipolaris oryzae ATCC 44560]
MPSVGVLACHRAGRGIDDGSGSSSRMQQQCYTRGRTTANVQDSHVVEMNVDGGWWDGATAVATGERGPPEIALSGIEGRIRRGMILAVGLDLGLLRYCTPRSPSLSLPPRVVVKADVGAGAGVGVGVSRGSRYGCGGGGNGWVGGWMDGWMDKLVAESSVPQRRRPKHSCTSASGREKCRGQPTGCSPSTARPPRRESASRRALTGHGEQRRRPPTLLDPGLAPLHH